MKITEMKSIARAMGETVECGAAAISSFEEFYKAVTFGSITEDHTIDVWNKSDKPKCTKAEDGKKLLVNGREAVEVHRWGDDYMAFCAPRYTIVATKKDFCVPEKYSSVRSICFLCVAYNRYLEDCGKQGGAEFRKTLKGLLKSLQVLCDSLVSLDSKLGIAYYFESSLFEILECCGGEAMVGFDPSNPDNFPRIYEWLVNNVNRLAVDALGGQEVVANLIRCIAAE